MTKTQRHTGRAIRRMLQIERTMQAAEAANNWDVFSANSTKFQRVTTEAHSGLMKQGVSWGAAWGFLSRVGR